MLISVSFLSASPVQCSLFFRPSDTLFSFGHRMFNSLHSSLSAIRCIIFLSAIGCSAIGCLSAFGCIRFFQPSDLLFWPSGVFFSAFFSSGDQFNAFFSFDHSEFGVLTSPAALRQHRGTSLMKKRPPPQDPCRALGMVLHQGPKRRRFLVSEVPLHFPWPFRDGAKWSVNAFTGVPRS